MEGWLWFSCQTHGHVVCISNPHSMSVSSVEELYEEQKRCNVVSIHDCKKCDLNPCTTRPIISGGKTCSTCPINQYCCKGNPLVALMPCEINSGLIEHQKIIRDTACIKWENGNCYAFNTKTGKCNIYTNRPLACRIATCRFISGMVM